MANGATAFPDIFSCLLSMLTQQARSTEIKDYCQKSSVNISLLGEHIFAEAICGKSVNQLSLKLPFLSFLEIGSIPYIGVGQYS